MEVLILGPKQFATLLAVGVLFALPMAGCGDDGEDGDGADTTAPIQETATAPPETATEAGAGGTLRLTATDFEFMPSNPTVQSGEVTFVLNNEGQAPHSLDIENVDGEAQLEPVVEPGQTGRLTVNLAPGTYRFYCPVGNHEELGMTGEITVE